MENKKAVSLPEMKKELIGRIKKLPYREARLVLAFIGGLTGEDNMGKVVEFEQKQDVEGMDGSMVYTKYLVDGNEERVEFDGTVYMACKECGEEISMDIRELISHETASEDFTEFKGFTCHDCIQKEKQAVEPNKIRGNR